MEKSSKNKIYTAMGLMSGTAMDGIDIALVETDGDSYVRPLLFEAYEMPSALRDLLKSCLNCADRYTPNVKEAERLYTQENTKIIKKFINKNNILVDEIEVIGWHGQTIHHAPDEGVTIQVGDGGVMADVLTLPVVNEFRLADILNGGQGAPFIPVYHRALVQAKNHELPTAIINIGGVANITWMNQDVVIGFDSGPGNAMINDWVLDHAGYEFDYNGEIASRGRVNHDVLNDFLNSSYFLKKYPKSLDRNDFINLNCSDLSCSDGAATLTEMTVQSINIGLDQCPQKPNVIYVTGGGRHNKFMMQRLALVSGCKVRSVDELGWNGDAVEAEGFAYMAVRTLKGLPISFPGTTGCNSPTIGGVLHNLKRSAA
jgi:anhydro-N-acetylmuramic acid kinase